MNPQQSNRAGAGTGRQERKPLWGPRPGIITKTLRFQEGELGRPKRYENGAEKQRAYRRRLAEDMVRVNRRSLETLEAQVERLHGAVVTARRAGHPVAMQVSVFTVGAALEGLAAWFEAQVATGPMDTPRPTAAANTD